MVETIKRTVRVTITKVVEVELPAAWGSAENIADWSRGLWHINGIDDIAKFAARMAAVDCEGTDIEGIGLLGQRDLTYGGKAADVIFKETDEYYEEEIIPDGEI
jgi:hypothetical protein